MSLVKLENISHEFGSLNVLNTINLELAQGEVLGMFGHNGAGKTTIMKIILGLVTPSQGKVTVLGEDPTSSHFNARKFQLGFLPENIAFYPQLTGLEILRFYAKLKQVSQTRCDELLETVGLTVASKRKVKTYSKGMKQRLGLAQALLTKPSLLLLDEPTVGLDPVATREFYLLVDELRQAGSSIILCSHILSGVEQHIDRALVLKSGQVRALGTVAELRKATKLPTQISFSGCFDLHNLQQKFSGDIQIHDEKSYSLKVTDSSKLEALEFLLKQPGIQQLDTHPASLEQVYFCMMQTQSENKKVQQAPPISAKEASQ